MPLATESRLRLADHVRACSCGSQTILLDLRRNRYIAVPNCRELAAVVDGWPAGAVESSKLDGTESDVLASLLSRGLLTDLPSTFVPDHPRLMAPVRSSNSEDTQGTSAVDFRRVHQLLRVGIAASWQLRWQSLAAIAEAVAVRRAQLPAVSADVLEEVPQALTAYTRLRVFAFTTHDRCLHDALTLTGFLAAEGIACLWVIGVRTRPFAAHSWAQIGDTVLNDHHERVRTFVPILVA